MWLVMHRLSISAVRVDALFVLAPQRGRRICGPVAQR
jgi:hypothetical protein